MKHLKTYWRLWLLAGLCGISLIILLSPAKAAVVKGTNCGFVTVAPTADPADGDTVADAFAHAMKDLVPVGATKIVEMGWWCDNDTEAANFEVGLYSDDSGNTLPLNRLFVAATNAKGTTAGWKRVTVDWDISGLGNGTAVWLARELDNTATATNTNYTAAGTGNHARRSNATTLPDPWLNSDSGTRLYAIYAVWEAAPAAGGQVIIVNCE